MGAEQILSLFQDILASSKQKFLPKWHPIFATIDDKALVEMFMSFLSNADAVRSGLSFLILLTLYFVGCPRVGELRKCNEVLFRSRIAARNRTSGGS